MQPPADDFASTLEALLQIGRAVELGEPFPAAKLSEIRTRSEINRQTPHYWSSAVKSRTDSEISGITRGLTIAESHFCWTGGSVSGVIWLFRELVNRQADKQLLDNLSAWILANTNNPYNPFGTRVSLGAKDYSDYLARSRSRSNQIANLVLTDKQLEASAAEERRIRRIRSQAGAIARNTEARSEIIAALNLMSIEEKLDRIARDPEYPPQFFPTRIANAASQSIISALPLDVRLQLARRLKGKRRGPWGEFKKRLYASIGPVWNKSAWGV